ncbi:MAG: hypothetical protein P9M13_07460 [Candidatus Ancaeobacter aquaticus]|nr:hypothetical protein [Candidatus Ancaeobacter aquaticus]
MENGRLAAIIALVVGVGVVLSLPKMRKRLKEWLAPVGGNIKEGYLAATKKIKKEKSKNIKLEKVAAKKKPKTRKSVINVKAKKVSAKPAPVGIPTNVSPETENAIIKVLKESPGGKTLVDLGMGLGTHFVKLAIPIKRLVEQGKVRKKEKLYFAVA